MLKTIEVQELQKLKEFCLRLNSLLVEKIGHNFNSNLIYQDCFHIPVIIKDVSEFINYLIDRDISGELWDDITKKTKERSDNWYYCLKNTFFEVVEYHLYFREVFTLDKKINNMLNKISEQKSISICEIKELLSILYHKNQLKINCYNFLKYQTQLIERFLDACFILKIRVQESDTKETNEKQKLLNNLVISCIDNFIQKDYVELNILCKRKIEKIFEALDEIQIY